MYEEGNMVPAFVAELVFTFIFIFVVLGAISANAPAIFEGGNALSQLWLFIIAPFLGAILAAEFWKYFECQKCK